MPSRVFPGNEHPIERTIRVVLGIVLLALVIVGPHTRWGAPWSADDHVATEELRDLIAECLAALAPDDAEVLIL